MNWATPGGIGQLRPASGFTPDRWQTFTTTLTAGGCVGWGANMWVVGGSSGVASRSPDLITWTNIALGGTTPITSVAFGNGTFVLTNGTTMLFRSTNGIAWTTATAPFAMSYVVFGNGRFLGIGANSAATSADGSTGSWTTYTLTGSYARLFYGTANTFVAFQTASTNIATTTDNGSSWTQQAVAVPGGQFWGGGYGNGTYVILGAQTPFATSTDGLSWTARTAAIFSGLAFNFVAFGNGLFVTASTAAGASRNIAISLDGINWTNQTTTTAIGNMQFQAGTYANGMFVLLAGNGGIAAPW